MLTVSINLEFPKLPGDHTAIAATDLVVKKLEQGGYPITSVDFQLDNRVKTLHLDEPLVLQKQVADIPTIIEDDLYEEATMQKILDVLRNKNTNPKQVKVVHKLLAVLVHFIETDDPAVNLVSNMEDDFIKAFRPDEEEKG